MVKILFFGTPEFSAKVLTYLLDHGIDVVGVISKPDRPKGRSSTPVPTPVKVAIQTLRPTIPVFQPEKVSATEFTETVQQFQADLFVVVAYGEIIKQHLLDMPRLGCINLHTSLLPKYRGAAPVQRAIMNGETVTGVTIIHMVKKMDAGDMIRKVEVPIGIDDTHQMVESELCRVGSELLLQVIHEISEGKAGRTAQDETGVTLAPKIELEDCEINWQLPATTIHNLIRAVSPEPGAWCYVHIKGEKKRFKIFRSKLSQQIGESGKILSWGKEGFIIGCGKDSIEVQELQLEGKKAMTASEFMRGFQSDQLFF